MSKELWVDNRILLALSEITGEAGRKLNNIFIFGKDGQSPVYFASNEHCAIKIEEVQQSFNFDGDFALSIPDVFKKIVKFDKKEPNEMLNKTNIIFDKEKVKLGIFNELPFKLEYSYIIPKFEKMPDVFNDEKINKDILTFDPALVQSVNKALMKLGFKSMVTFEIAEQKLKGYRENEEFIVEFCIMGGTDAE